MDDDEWRSEVVEYVVPGGRARRYVAYRSMEDGGDGSSRYTYRIADGGRRGGAACMSLSGDVFRDDWRRPTTMHIDVLHSYPKCLAQPGGMDKGDGEHMARAALCRVVALLPNVVAITLQDESYNLCGVAERDAGEKLLAQLFEVSLAHHNMMVHGATWYMRKLGAVPGDAHCARTVRAWQDHVASAAPSTPEALRAALHGASRALTRVEVAMVVDAAFPPPRRGASSARTAAASTRSRSPRSGTAAPMTWMDVYARVDRVRVGGRPTGCILFGKLAVAARALAGALAGADADMLRAQIFEIPAATVRAWIAERAPSATDLGPSTDHGLTFGGGWRGWRGWSEWGGWIGDRADGRALVDAVFRAATRLRLAVGGHFLSRSPQTRAKA